MTLTSYERGDTFLSTHIFYSGTSTTSFIDPLNNLAYINVYDPNGVLYISHSGERLSSGNYQYYISTSTTAPLGIYTIDWWGSFYTDDLFGYMPKHERESILLDTVSEG
jgi:hypothetical protein